MTNLLCPHCERKLEQHDDSYCKRKMSRRFFFGALAGGVASVLLFGKTVADKIVLRPGDRLGISVTGTVTKTDVWFKSASGIAYECVEVTYIQNGRVYTFHGGPPPFVIAKRPTEHFDLHFAEPLWISKTSE